MTGKADFTEGDWRIVLESLPAAGMIVVTAQRGGTFRETLAIAKAYAEARKQLRLVSMIRLAGWHSGAGPQ